MSDTRRAEYLRTLGIGTWRLRGAAVAGAAPPAPIAGPASDSVVRVVAAAVPDTGAVPDLAALDWPALRSCVASCTRCVLSQTRTQTVFGVGDQHARWLIVGEGPGAEEDRRGEPFVGRAGSLLNAMLRAMGLAREQVYIANVVKCRPPGNRDPSVAEAKTCLGYLHRQIALIQPAVMLAVGRIAAQNLLQTDAALGKMRQTVHHFGDSRVPLVVTYHPAYLLRSPAEKRKAWDDLRFAQQVMERVRSQT
jgi:DNA polymerase